MTVLYIEDGLQLIRVTEDGLDQVAALWMDAYRFMQANGIRQWLAEQVTPETVAYAFVNSDMFLIRNGENAVGTFFLLPSDPALWGERSGEGDAEYLHRLVVGRRYAGQGMGIRLLKLAERYLLDKGRRYLRLDCMADNPKLNAFYQGAGFTFKGRVEGDGWSAHLYEKELG